MTRVLHFIRAVCVTAAAAVFAVGAAAQGAYPNKAVRIVVPYPPGGGADILARVVGQRLSEVWKQPVLVENKAGAGGSIGTESVARAPADGYTLLMASPSHSINASLYKNLNFDTLRAFTPVTIAASGPLVLVVSPTAPFRNVMDLVAYAKANPGKLAYASAGTGSSPHMAGELLALQAGVEMTHVPYRGTAPALVDLMGGRVQAFFAPVPTILEHVRAGKLKMLAVTTKKRFATLPEVPTIAESGFPDYELLQWWGFMAPAGTPREVLREQHTQIKKILDSAEVRERLAALGAEPGGGPPEQFDALVREEIPRWSRVVEAAKMTPN
jgi:tripartite-type tricarboxylate transporter receptor subunit TctC